MKNPAGILQGEYQVKHNRLLVIASLLSIAPLRVSPDG